MARDNSSTLPDDQDQPPRKLPTSVHFEDALEITPEPDWRYEETKRRRQV